MGKKARNDKIRETFIKTKMKRRSQVCKVVKVKVQTNKLSEAQRTQMKMMFVEAKWIYNYCLSTDDVYQINAKDLKEVPHLNKNGETVVSTLQYVGSSVKESIINEIKYSIKGLSHLKKHGYKVGKLKFKSDYTSLNFKQYGVTHKIVDGYKIKLQGIKKPLYVNGLEQLKEYEKIGYDIANCKLIKVNDSYQIALTIFVDAEKLNGLKKENNKNDVIGVDFGCQTTLTLSNGEKFNASVEETEHLKRLQRKLQHNKKGSNNRRKTILKIDKEYTKISNRKNDIANKIVHHLLSGWENIVIQDEQLNKWKKTGHGKKIQHSVLGRVKYALIKQKNVFVIHKFVPTTKICLECGHVFDNLKLSDREVVCPNCGIKEDRDVHAAKNMVWYFKNRHKIGVGRTEFKRVDFDKAMYELFSDSYNAFKGRSTKIQPL